MAIIVLIAVATLLKWLLLLVTLPLLLELFFLTLGSIFSASRLEDGTPGFAPLKRLMIVVPSHNEELSITRCIQSLAAATGDASHVLVIAHNCEDATAELALKAGARVEVVNDPERRGKGHALKHGFDFAFTHCGADAVMIVDADSTVSENITVEVKRQLTYSPVVQCRYQVKNYADSWRTTLTSLAFLGINVIRPRGRDFIGLSCGIFGNGFAMRKEVLDNVDYDAHSIVEDMEFHLALVKYGYRVRFVREALVLGDMPLTAGTSASQHSRWEGGRVRLLRDWGLPLAQKVLRGNLRLAEPLIDLLSLPLALEVFSLLILLLYPTMLTRTYVSAAFAVILLHIAVVVHASPDRMGSIRTLCLAPVYLFWRLKMFKGVVKASGKGATWVRTTRDVSAEIQPHDLLTVKAVNSSQESS
jgi:cellulose synthase/poly-beta-1,6-N-acetylglucosamine synthase-like glycosyltransferase